ncbi:MAG TPA: D-alanyl-D-alanine carboxypeptidase family protein, partial [Ruminiclostridium sp.]|nr:D-alanyl-D-alanine carboxypeptidase family protein [Ruminiclostridium sp.]
SGAASQTMAQSSGQSSGSKSSTTAVAAQSKPDNNAAQTPANGPTLAAKSAILVEQSTGRVLYENNAHEKLPPASITKIMTELLTLEAIEDGKLKWDEKLTCSEHAASMGGSDIWLEPNEQMTVKDLFKAMAIGSANDAAVVFAEKIGGSEQGFVSLMNQKAKQLGMNDTHFVNANGLDADGHETSAYDVMLMSRELLKHKQIFDFCTVWMDSLRGGKTQLVNTNKLIRTYNGINGLKTGSTGNAGYCVSASAIRDGMQLIAVTMGSDNSKDRFTSASNLLDYGFGGWSLVKAKLSNTKYNVKVIGGEKSSVSATISNAPDVLVAKGKEKSVTQKVSIVSDVAAPVEKGQVLGQVTLWADGKNIGTVAIKADTSVSKMSFGKAFLRLIGFACR